MTQPHSGRRPDEILESFAALTERVPRPRPLSGEGRPHARSAVVGLTGVAVLAVVGVALFLAAPKNQNNVSGSLGRDGSVENAVEWHVDFAYPISANSTELHVIAEHRSCEFTEQPVAYLPPRIEYHDDTLTVTVIEAAPPIDETECRSGARVSSVPVTVRLSEPIGDRSLLDGSVPHRVSRWHPPDPGLIALPTYEIRRRPEGVPFVTGCPDVGLEGVTLTGDPADPRVAWLVNDDGSESPTNLKWPPGYAARFDPELQIVTGTGQIVWRAGDRPLGGCVVGDHAVTLSRAFPVAAPERVDLLTHRMTDAPADVGTHTGIVGITISGDSPCLFISVPERRWLTVWPAGAYLDVSTEPPVIRDASGNRLTALGEIFTLSGVSVAAAEADAVSPHLDSVIPGECRGVDLLLIDHRVSALQPKIATWRIDSARPPDPAATTLAIEIHENACSSGTDPRGRTLPPEIDYGPAEIVITLKVLEIGGRCPGNPSFPMTIELTEPVGDRTLIDGSDGGVRWPVAPPASASPAPSVAPTTPRPAADLVGPLVGTDLAGPCSFVAADGELWTVAWPAGYQVLNDQRPILLGPGGLVVAGEGDIVGLSGRATDRMSPVCMTGRIFEADSIAFVERSADEPWPFAAARNTALADPLLLDYIIRHPYHEVESEIYAIDGGLDEPIRPAILVTLRFFGFADDYPLGSCDIAREVDHVVGVAWMIDITGSEILARSPIWVGDIRCI